MTTWLILLPKCHILCSNYYRICAHCPARFLLKLCTSGQTCRMLCIEIGNLLPNICSCMFKLGTCVQVGFSVFKLGISCQIRGRCSTWIFLANNEQFVFISHLARRVQFVYFFILDMLYPSELHFRVIMDPWCLQYGTQISNLTRHVQFECFVTQNWTTKNYI